jgi:hypothetical protein
MAWNSSTYQKGGGGWGKSGGKGNIVLKADIWANGTSSGGGGGGGGRDGGWGGGGGKSWDNQKGGGWGKSGGKGDSWDGKGGDSWDGKGGGDSWGNSGGKGGDSWGSGGKGDSWGSGGKGGDSCGKSGGKGGSGSDIKSPSKDCGLRSPDMRVEAGTLVNLVRDTFLTETDLWACFHHICAHAKFQEFAGRSIMDFKIAGQPGFQFAPRFEALNPLLDVMTTLARQSLHPGEELALIQVVVNYFKDGGNDVKPHTHRCRQICVSLGAPRDLNVEGKIITMGFADALALAGEKHSVPRANGKEPRVSICLFYGSTREYRNHCMSVNANNKSFGSSFWFTHPTELRALELKWR